MRSQSCVDRVGDGGCTVDAPPAPQSTDTTQTSAPPLPKATQIIMGIDNIGPGFNPHLLSDQSPVNAAISALVLPSAFRPVADTGQPDGVAVGSRQHAAVSRQR